ncbi:unnamed protein product [Parascedosporium putredinis]|uniref:Uncharacterized protein n=1 Tax=Parascedosporium putredinis TaxID=1442378 RepID=A0A9P1H561_9PEZI|nr:unnamed protein product [Parascedosporium putredinis]CAI7997608.1 unnamed protein product [Parascedosporium putredinis]
MFSGKTQIPCVGISFGVDRIFSITKARLAADKSAAAVRKNEVDVYVMAFGGKGFTGLLKERMEVCSRLWGAGIKAEFLYKDEWNNGKVKVKEMGLRDGHPEKEGVEVALDNLVADVKAKLARRAELEDMTRQAEGLKVVHGIKGEELEVSAQPTTTEAAAPDAPAGEQPVTEEK